MNKENTTSPGHSKKVKVFKLVGKIFAGLIMLILLAFVSITVVYPAILRSANRIDSPYGVDSMEIVEIGGIYQALYFRGQNVENPVVLFLHGGPGSPHMPMIHDYQFELEHYFTIVQWDQPNAGKTFFLNDPDVVLETLSFERVLIDAYEVTQYIRLRLGVDQIILVGYSWGSLLGTALVQAHPQYFSAYISIGQNVNQRESERLAFEALLELAHASGDQRHIANVEALGPPPLGDFDENWVRYIIGSRDLMQRHGFVTNSLLDGRIAFTSPFYSLRERMYFMTVDVFKYQLPLLQYVFDEALHIRNFGTTYYIPVFYIMGELDRQTSYQLAKEFFEEIIAPQKSFFSIPNAGHAPMHENTAEFNRIFIEEIRPLILAR